ncbi:MAG: PTS glucose transporter subunit IIA [Collinsella sp.]
MGTVMDISEVNDPVFAGKAMGDGIAIVPSEGVLVAPISGTVEALFPTGHALAIKDEAGMGVMLHIGIDTVDMKGDGFIARIAQGDRVEAGQILVEFDREKIAAAGFEDNDDDGRHRARFGPLIGQVPCWRRLAR